MQTLINCRWVSARRMCILANKRRAKKGISVPALMTCVAAAVLAMAPQFSAQPAPITVDYPADRSMFPPEITPPPSSGAIPSDAATLWLIDISFGGGSPALHLKSRGERMAIGEIDPRCVAPTNKPAGADAHQAAAHTWTPDAATWSEIKRRSVDRAATLTITGVREADPNIALSRGRVTIQTSKDPVGAPIFYRDVPLMPCGGREGCDQAAGARRHPADRLAAPRHRRAEQPADDGRPSHLRQLPLLLTRRQDAGHGHGRSQNDKGMYALVPGLEGDVHPQTRT